MQKVTTPFPDVWVIQPKVFRDTRGFFFEAYSQRKFKAMGLNYIFVQDNHSKSVKNSLRGLHFQFSPGQVKLVRCSVGKIWDVIVDIRPNSPTYKKWWGTELSADNFKQILIPVGFAHGFSVLSEIAEVQYKVTTFYNPDLESGIRWNDSEFNIDWHIQEPILSPKDQKQPTFAKHLEIAANYPPFEFNAE